jgi:hypothetical protein
MIVDLSPTLIASVATALVAVIGAAAGAIVRVLRELQLGRSVLQATREAVATTQAVVQENAEIGRQAGKMRDQKLDNITILVDGRYGQVLQELADVRQLLATHSGTTSDQAAASIAQQAADDQERRVEQSKARPTP